MAIFGSELEHGLDQQFSNPKLFFYVVVTAGLLLGALLARYLAASGSQMRKPPGKRRA